MKVSKLKTLLYFLGAFILFATVSVDAASISITKSLEQTEKNVAKYEVYLDATDGEIEGITITFNTSDSKILPHIRKADNLTDVTCGTSEYCKLDGKYSSKLKIADITVTNSTEANIENFTVSASAENIGNVSSDPITLETAKIEEETTTKAKSSNAELSNIAFSVSSATLSPEFTTSGRSYTVTGIKDTVNSVTISTTCENCTTVFTCLDNCNISDNKNNRIMLEHGANEIELVTTSEDGTNTNTYNFIIYRGEVEEPSAYLKDLKIENVELDTKFDMLLNDYTATVDLETEKLDIKYELEDPEAKVEIKGADKLVEGENIITVTVTSSDGKSKQVYTITVNKEDICDPETENCSKNGEYGYLDKNGNWQIADTEEEKEKCKNGELKCEYKDMVQKIEKKKNDKVWLIVLLVIIALLIIGLSGFFIFKKKKDKKDKDQKNKKKESKLKKAFIEEETEEVETKEVIEEEKPKIKPSVDEALEDLMKTKEIELNNL